MADYTLKSDLRQRDIEAFFKARREIEAGCLEVPATQLAAQLVELLQSVRSAGLKPGTPEFLQVFQEFARELRMRQAPAQLSGPEATGVSVRAAIRAGWLSGLDEGVVGELKPAIVRDLAQKVDDSLRAAYNLPGE